MQPIERQIISLYEMLKLSKYTVFFTGAGISTESGIPDFRSPGGGWTKHKPIPFQDFIQSKEARRESWKRKFAVEPMMNNAKPNSGHMAISTLIDNDYAKLVITQNVDGLHQLSGIPETKIVELHGNSTYANCLTCLTKYQLHSIRNKFISDSEPPTCQHCGGLIKTATISFGQPMPEREMDRAGMGVQACELFIVVGSSLVVYPAAGFPIAAKDRGAKVVIVNREATELDHIADLVINAEIGATLSAVMNCWPNKDQV